MFMATCSVLCDRNLEEHVYLLFHIYMHCYRTYLPYGPASIAVLAGSRLPRGPGAACTARRPGPPEVTRITEFPDLPADTGSAVQGHGGPPLTRAELSEFGTVLLEVQCGHLGEATFPGSVGAEC